MVDGVGKNNLPKQVDTKTVGQEMAKGGSIGGLKDSIGNLLGKSDKTKTSAEDKPMKGLGIEHNDENTNKTESGNGKVSGMVDYTVSGAADYIVSGEVSGMVEYTASGTVMGEVDYQGSVDYTPTGTVGYSANGTVMGEVDYQGSVDYTPTGTVGYSASGNVENTGMVDYKLDGTIDYTGSITGDVPADFTWEKWSNDYLEDSGTGTVGYSASGNVENTGMVDYKLDGTIDYLGPKE